MQDDGVLKKGETFLDTSKAPATPMMDFLKSFHGIIIDKISVSSFNVPKLSSTLLSLIHLKKSYTNDVNVKRLCTSKGSKKVVTSAIKTRQR